MKSFFLGRILPALAALALLTGPRAAAATEDRAPIVVAVLPAARDMDAASLREAIARELGAPVVTPEDPAAAAASFTITIDEDHVRGELVISRRSRGDTVVRRVALPQDGEETQRTAVFLVGNLARDEAGELIDGMRAHSAPRQPDAPPSHAEDPFDAPSPPLVAPRAPRRLWIGVAIEGDMTLLPSQDDACKSSAYSCATRGDSPGTLSPLVRDTIVAGQGDTVSGGLALANARVTLTVEYAVSNNLLAGVRVGYATGTTPGAYSFAFGHAHAEARATYVFGDHPLTRQAMHVAPAMLVAAGLAEHSASVPVTYFFPRVTAYDGPYAGDAWRIAGPMFASAGLGVRVTTSEKTAILILPAKATYAFGSQGSQPFLASEIGAQFGF